MTLKFNMTDDSIHGVTCGITACELYEDRLQNYNTEYLYVLFCLKLQFVDAKIVSFQSTITKRFPEK